MLIPGVTLTPAAYLPKLALALALALGQLLALIRTPGLAPIPVPAVHVVFPVTEAEAVEAVPKILLSNGICDVDSVSSDIKIVRC